LALIQAIICASISFGSLREKRIIRRWSSSCEMRASTKVQTEPPKLEAIIVSNRNRPSSLAGALPCGPLSSISEIDWSPPLWLERITRPGLGASSAFQTPSSVRRANTAAMKVSASNAFPPSPPLKSEVALPCGRIAISDLPAAAIWPSML
jgi:hypothetical protein